MSIGLVLLILAFISMLISVKPPKDWTLNFMTLSFAILILRWIVLGYDSAPLLHR